MEIKKIKSGQENVFLQNLTKAYTEGVYADTPQNRKLGRVGMSYAAYSAKVKKENEEGKTQKQKEVQQYKSLSELPWVSLGGGVKYVEFEDFEINSHKDSKGITYWAKEKTRDNSLGRTVFYLTEEEVLNLSNKKKTIKDILQYRKETGYQEPKEKLSPRAQKVREAHSKRSYRPIKPRGRGYRR